MTRAGLLASFAFLAVAGWIVYAAGSGDVTVIVTVPTQPPMLTAPSFPTFPSSFRIEGPVLFDVVTSTPKPPATADIVTAEPRDPTCETPVAGMLCEMPTKTPPPAPTRPTCEDRPAERYCRWATSTVVPTATVTPAPTEATRGRR
jgi:hypothetical protein